MEKRGYPVVDIKKPIPWDSNDESLRAWNFMIHSFDMLDSLLCAHSITNRKSYIEVCIKIAIDWSRLYSEASITNSSFAWYDMAVGLRSYRLSYIYDVASSASMLSPEIDSLLWDSIRKHQLFLASDKNIKFHNNHGYYQVAGQLAMARRFLDKSSAMKRLYVQGEDRLKKMIYQQFTDEGVHREHSPDYHRMVYNTLRCMIDTKLVRSSELILFANKIESALSWFVPPRARVVNLGDTDNRLVFRFMKEAKRKWKTPEMRYVSTSGMTGVLPGNIVAHFPKSGYFVVRKPSFEDPKNFTDSSYLVQSAAFHSRTHKHADDLSFIWCDRGADILTDSGRYGYIGKTEQGSELWHDGHWYSDPHRIYCESTRAHNTLEFDGENYPRKGVKPYGSALGRWLQDDSGMVTVESECRHFRGLRRVRVLFFMPSKWLVVFDWFQDGTDQKHDVKQWFHLSPQLELLTQDDGFISYLPSSDKPLKIKSLLPDPVASRPIIGQEEPQLQGWWSGKERDFVPNYAFCYQLSGAMNGVFATLFSFSDTLSTDSKWSKVNVSGRKGQFLWEDDEAKHKLRFERPAEGDMTATYSVR